ncbi:S8 family peptidase [Roseibacillus ishigakijimensis]|uniref:S8 family serine peptidase n=1 Tax=Roseibacillus ishigakijimensis TaxID=454146 RepID=A0A934VL37_9BACT|nr:S8 family serine peptidase [Roseibacillus ishigakijimensis]MBK1832817.1 S8 family serine peptidase [Roseibacillus ishigakijimensis]
MKIKPLEWALMAAFILLAILVGRLVVSDVAEKTRGKAEKPAQRTPILTQTSPEARRTERDRKSALDVEVDPRLARRNERLVTFDTEEDYRNFLNSLSGSNLRLLGQIDALRAVWLGFDRLSDFDGLLDEDQLGYNYLVTLPLPPGDGGVQAGAVPFGGNALEWLGITSDNSSWGSGVTIAIIDTGILAHNALPENIRHLNLVPGDDPSSEWHGHGTAVASLIAGQNGTTPGVAPSANLLDVRVADSNGDSSSFLLAQGIVAAVDAGAQVLNISMGSYGDSALVANAVAYAYANGAVIIASSGNEGYQQPAFPAGYPEVIAVGAVDAAGELVDFSNTGENIDLTAPGLEVYAAWSDNKYIAFTGTSASAPYPAATVAAVMSEFNLSAENAVALMMQNANEAGEPGQDTFYGLGHLAVDRTMNSNTPGLYDVAAVSNLVKTNDGNSVVAIVQNQGTATIPRGEVVISTPYAQVPQRLHQLAPGETQVFEFPTTLPQAGEAFSITTSVTLDSSLQEIDSENNIKSNQFVLDPGNP